MQEPLFVVVPKDMPQVGSSIEALAGTLPLIRYSPNGYLGHQVDDYLRTCDVTLPRQYELDTSDAVLAMVKAGLGWTISTPLCVLKTQRDADDFRYLPLRSPARARRIRLFAHRDQHAVLWQHVAQTCRALLERDWLARIRVLAPWDRVARTEAPAARKRTR